ncbi:Mediator of RNA polymerase II transcription subunit 33A [Rhynchospora pubera]|uniref:Mediator of RNA polymerase II transcription subunit 33A n=1 Tax=Rhynchospora pubera TaxID=906938 RepID=A0AAV8ELC2_9POAL|nr:Mediator of RNA polymerase II transcription subunit 33A [Rhynchospora pubera]
MAYATSTIPNLQLPNGKTMLSTREETMEVSVSPSPTPELERRVMAVVTASEARGDPPFACAVEVSRCCVSDENEDLGFPNADLASVLVSNLCFAHNTPFMWKLLEQAMANRLVYPLQVLALLTSRVVPNRTAQPEAYRLSLELIRRYSLSFSLVETGPRKKMIVKSIDGAMLLSHTYQVEEIDFGTCIVLFVFSTITTLIDCVFEDYGLPFASHSRVVNEGPKYSDLDTRGKHGNHLRESNAFMALETLENISSLKKIQHLLHLVYLNMPATFNKLLQRLRFIETPKLSTNSLAAVNHLLEKLFSNVQKSINLTYLPNKHNILGYLLNTGSMNSPPSLLIGAGRSGCWITVDIFMENSMERKTCCPGAVFEKLTELITTLQIINQASWQETFQALWLSALRLVQRVGAGREPMIGPLPHLDSRMCMLLAIVPLSIVPLLKESSNTSNAGGNGILSRKQSLVACLQSLKQFPSLLSPPLTVVDVANDAAKKAASFVRDYKAGSGNLGMMPSNYSSMKAVGNLLHLVVEACIARDLIDTTAYFWPGYVLPAVVTKDPDLILIQEAPWLSFMQGAPLTGPLQSALMATPSPSIIELEKLNILALNGTEEERTAASKILCGASLTRGWNIQEHVVRIVVKLLSPPQTSDNPISGDTSGYLCHMHMLSAVLSCLAHVDVIHILTLYGVVSQVAAALMPLCEAFGSMPPPPTYQSSNEDEVTVYSIFSFAFLFLVRLYKFYGPVQEQLVSSRGGPVRPETTLDRLLLMRNNHVCTNDGLGVNDTKTFHKLPSHSVYIDSFPKLRNWYFQNQACVASVISGLCKPKPSHQVANLILNMICRKMNKGEVVVSDSSSMSTGAGTSTSTMTSSSMSESSGSVSEESCQRPPLLPAWEMLEAVPFVLEALLSAYAYGRLSSRDLTTGLRLLVDFFPASVVTITTYFSAEITRGIWKSVQMNGTEWPSPAEGLYTFESEIKEVLSHVGVYIQNSYPRGMAPTLPLPLAALGSLTITFKLDKKSDYTRDVVGEALENCATGCSWPSMLIIGALWTQKARRWYDFIIFVATRAPFMHMKEPIEQLMRSCFKAFLGPISGDGSSLTSVRGIIGLMGQSVTNNSDLSPGLLFVRTCHTFQDPHFCSEIIFKLVIEWSGKLTDEQACGGLTLLKFGGVSLAAAICIVRQVAIIGASLLCVAGRALLVQVLFEETVPTSLLSQHEKGSGQVLSSSNILQGYAISYLMFFSTAFVWGTGAKTAAKLGSPQRRARMICNHLDFIARVMEGRIVLGCDPFMWKAHVLCFVGLLVRFAPAWVTSVKLDTLQKISSGLRIWDEFDLAISLLELGGMGAIEAVVESFF